MYEKQHLLRLYIKHTCMKLPFLLFVTTICFAAHAQTPQKVNIEQATVFLNGAELTSTAKVTLPMGETEVLFTNVAGNMNQQSLSVGADNNVVVQSATFKNDYLNEQPLSPKSIMIKDSVELLTDDKKVLENKMQVLNEQIVIFNENHKISGNSAGLSVAELQKMLDLVNSKMGAILADINTQRKKIDKINNRIELLNRQMEEESKKEFQPGGQLLVKFYTTKPTNASVVITYVVPNAGWSPAYDIRVDKINDPVKLFYKANIYQNCGVKWNNVHIVLSTGNPNQGVISPTLVPWYLAFYVPPPPHVAAYAKPAAKSMKNAITNNNKSAEEVSPYVANSYSSGSSSWSSAAPPTSVELAGVTMNDYVTVDNAGINTTFDIDLPYTVPSDGQQHIVSVKSYELPATYRYYAIPKLDKDAFLQAQVTKWEDMNLLPAATNIFYEGTYVGQGYIDMRNTNDTLNLSLGRDKKIIIRRERDKDLKSVKMIGTNKREEFVYAISVRNTKKEAIDLVLYDQFPVSNDKDLVIEEKEAADATIDETTGSAKWLLKINPNETMKKKISYTLKYPKEKTLQNQQ